MSASSDTRWSSEPGPCPPDLTREMLTRAVDRRMYVDAAEAFLVRAVYDETRDWQRVSGQMSQADA